MRAIHKGLCLLGIVATIQAPLIQASVPHQRHNVITGVNKWMQASLQFQPLSPFASVGRLHSAMEPDDFWKGVFSLGNRILEYTKLLLNTAATRLHIQEQIDHLKTTMDQIVSSAESFRDEIETVLHDKSLQEVSDDLSVLYESILEELAKEFPPSDRAPSHEERKKMVANVMARVEEGTIELLGKRGVPEDLIRPHFLTLAPFIEGLMVVVGDLAEQHPAILDSLLFSVTVLLIPESWFLRPLLSLFGFGPGGPVKGSVAAWAQRCFFGAEVPRGSWFAHLQRAAMKKGSNIIGAITAALGMSLTFFACR